MTNQSGRSWHERGTTLNRRTFLSSSGVGALALLAGCSGDNTSSENGGDDNDSDDGDNNSDDIQNPVAELDSCPPESISDSFEVMPDEPDEFEQFLESDGFGKASRHFQHVDTGAYFRIEIERRESTEAAEGASINTGYGKGIAVGGERDVDYNPEVGLLAHVEHAVLRIHGESTDDTDQVEALFQEMQCFTEDAVIERTWV